MMDAIHDMSSQISACALLLCFFLRERNNKTYLIEREGEKTRPEPDVVVVVLCNNNRVIHHGTVLLVVGTCLLFFLQRLLLLRNTNQKG